MKKEKTIKRTRIIPKLQEEVNDELEKLLYELDIANLKLTLKSKNLVYNHILSTKLGKTETHHQSKNLMFDTKKLSNHIFRSLENSNMIEIKERSEQQKYTISADDFQEILNKYTD